MMTQLIRREIRKFQPYQASPTLEQISCEINLPVEKIIKLDTGENPYIEKLQDRELMQKVSLYPYPDPLCSVLRNKLSEYTGYPPEWIICGNGSDELIDLIIRAFVEKKEEIIINPPTFPMYEFYGRLNSSIVKKVLRRRDFSINIDKIFNKISNTTKIIFIDSPGNPTGVVVSQKIIRQLLEMKIIVVIDEAYFEYCGITVLPQVRKYPNLVVLRSLSKWAGLAGVRIGYLVAPPEIIDFMFKIKPPYNVNSVAQAVASSILDNKDEVLKVINKLKTTRDKIVKRLYGIKQIKVFSSQSAYIVIKPQKDFFQLKKLLDKNGVILKVIDQPLMEKCLRINLGKEQELNRIILLLRRFYEN